MEDVVIDTSVIVKWYVTHREPDCARAETFLRHHTDGRLRLHIPALALYEMGNVLRHTAAHRGQPSPLADLSDLFALNLATHPLTLPQALLAFELAQGFEVSFYDACFVALAQELNLPFVTADEHLCRQMASLPFLHRLASYSR